MEKVIVVGEGSDHQNDFHRLPESTCECHKVTLIIPAGIQCVNKILRITRENCTNIDNLKINNK